VKAEGFQTDINRISQNTNPVNDLETDEARDDLSSENQVNL